MSRRMGFPRSDVERAMRHYGVSYSQAEDGLNSGLYTLPPRGTGLTQINLSETWNSLPLWAKGLVVLGSFAGAGAVIYKLLKR